jgi:hypothetical protein
MHIVDDYYLQGWLANGKQKRWWEQNAPDPMYKNDYLMALGMHSFSWSFMIMLPLAVLSFINGVHVGLFYAILLLVNSVIHGYVDDLKANKFKINLIQDQLTHIMQIFLTFIIYVLCV